jgi:putative membrane protein
MWVGKHRSWIATVALGGFALPHIWTRTLLVTGLSIVVTILHQRYLPISLKMSPFVMIGMPLGIFLGFRNNTAYDRFWEARKQWGALVNTSRSLTRQILTLIEPPEGQEKEARELETRILNVLIAYVHALRHHLRGHAPEGTLEKFLPSEDLLRIKGDPNPPLTLLHRLGELLLVARRKNWIHPFHVNILEQSLTSLTDIQGACERIKSTPIPFSYTVLMHRIVAGYCTLLPFGLAEDIGWATPVVVLGISYTFFGLDAIGEEIEDPFGLDTNDLPLKAISRRIEIDVRRLMGDAYVPEPVKPKNDVLI